MNVIRFTADGKVAERSAHPEASDKPPPLPPLEAFRLSNIINEAEGSDQIRNEMVDSLLDINENYTRDLDEQLQTIRDIENKEVLQRLDRIQADYITVRKQTVEQVLRRKQLYASIKKDMEVVNMGLLKSTGRIDALIGRLKRLEKPVRMRDRLFDLKSPNAGHYKDLYEYGMEKEIEAQKQKEEEEDAAKRQAQQPTAITIMPASPTTAQPVSTSPVKIEQYTRLEQHIKDLHREHSESISQFKNPVTLLTLDSPTTGFSDQVVEAETSPHEEETGWKGELKKIMKK